jgi:hypothetical protein
MVVRTCETMRLAPTDFYGVNETAGPADRPPAADNDVQDYVRAMTAIAATTPTIAARRNCVRCESRFHTDRFGGRSDATADD